ncbi:MAG: menaquinone biosynthesis decarboxylase [Nitrospina sp.]|jgi:4-hydroxy-3-polyprenylbenzoate decarboxylase|nr:menaquinone biosynthesis decarboxylase [Nitrospina sp.]MBT3508179.1 menaquinone biosynthesis decarboxylase [Nitrospina sp.]MBT3874842.1 menaquinone biosynthesis decarboxylase [Nitrospina sp.]MBT4047996.1 menaquinone biosynthesis decarboxylase [Nitrospina sp.]MBT4555955.1 menaquinone biosynthesis decarboxylase [Nitrospina sp.]
MKYPSLKEFIDRLELEGELLRIKESVSPILEIAEITDRVSKQSGGGKALLFENVEGSSMPVLINAFGSAKRMNMALGVHNIEDIPKRIERYIKIPPPTTLLDKAKLLPMLLQAAQFPPKLLQTSHPPCQEVVHLNDDIDLGIIPILQCWPQDAGRFITFPIVINRSVDKTIRNVGLYRMQVYDKKTTAMHWHIHKDGAHFFHEYRKQNKIMEVAVALGADPASCYSASAPMPYGIDEFLLAGFIRKASVPLVKCKTVDLEVPANAEIILEGYIDPSEMRLEGPFGDHTGYYSQDGDYPIFHITAITHRKDPVYLTTIVGIPPQEDYYLGRATERIFLPLLKTQLPEIVDMDMPVEGVFHNCVIVSFDKRYPMQSRRLMSALWGLGQMSFVKTIVTVDADVNVHNYEEVAKLLLDKVDFETDLFFSEGVLDVLNHASDQMLHGSKLGIDLTEKIEGEPGYGKETYSSEQNPLSPENVMKVFNEIRACKVLELKSQRRVMLVALDKTSPNQGKQFIQSLFESPEFSSIEIVIVLEGHVELKNISTVMWKFFNNLDPKRDFHFHEGRLGIDVTQKFSEEGYQQNWPEEIEMSSEIKSQVDKKWNDLFKE